MAIKLEEQHGGKVLKVSLSGRLIKEDYESIVPLVERAVEQHGKARMLVLMEDFQTWTPAGLKADIEFAAHHFKHIERLAVVGESQWQHGMAVSCRPFAAAEIGRFDRSALDAAIAWLAAA